MKYSGFKAKAIFTLGIYMIFWHYSQMCGLRDDFGVDIDPGSEILKGFVPIWGQIRYWWFINQIKAVEDHLGVPGSPISAPRTFFWSGLWFGAGPYINRHVNAMYTFRAGRAAGAATTPISGATTSWPEQFQAG